MVGLTATPKTDVDRNTYDFFEMEHGVPTYAYDYETAVYQDHVLVPYYNYEKKQSFLKKASHTTTCPMKIRNAMKMTLLRTV
jgi:type I restriction enzyme R subunit